jgi:hypothetical protein
MRQEALGWESEGVTLDKARVELAKLPEHPTKKEVKKSAFGCDKRVSIQNRGRPLCSLLLHAHSPCAA